MAAELDVRPPIDDIQAGKETSTPQSREEVFDAMRREQSGLLDDIEKSQEELRGATYFMKLGAKPETDDPSGLSDRRAFILNSPTKDKNYIVLTIGGAYSLSEDDRYGIEKAVKQGAPVAGGDTGFYLNESGSSHILLGGNKLFTPKLWAPTEKGVVDDALSRSIGKAREEAAAADPIPDWQRTTERTKSYRTLIRTEIQKPLPGEGKK